MFEKLVSGMYLGEILRQALHNLMKKASLFNCPTFSPLSTQYGITIAEMTKIDADHSPALYEVGEIIIKSFSIPESTLNDRKAVQAISRAIVRRSARLVAVAISAVCDHTGRFGSATESRPIDIGAHGSLVELYPHYLQTCLSACDEILGKNASRRINISKEMHGGDIGAAM